jgi:hypothetical protein
MQYKTISLELLRERTELYEQLRQARQLSPVLERWARELKESHDTWKETVAQAKPNSHPMQIASEAMEIALKEFADRLPPVSPPDDSERLDEAMAFIRNHTSNG